MRLTRLFNISSAKAISLAALTALAIAVAIGFLADAPTGATAFNAGGVDRAVRHIPIPAQFTEQCSNGVAVPNPANNPGLVADCAALLALKDTIEGTMGNLNWSADRAISDWEGVDRSNNGIVTANSRVSGLQLSDDDLNGTIPAELGNLTNIRYLHINSTDMTGEIPAELGNLVNLESLEIDRNDLTGAIPAELGNLANLESLYLNGNEFTGAIPAELGNLANLTILWLSGNELTGAIPAELGNLVNLKWLHLNNNQLTGAIPAQLGNLASLENLSLNNNRLTGEIPAQLGNLASLEGLSLNNNGLTGEIPAQLGNLANLEGLYLNNNQLTGAIPAQLGNLANLEVLYLNNNRLMGEIPAQLGNLNGLNYLSLHGNQFTGCIPQSLRATNFEFALAEPIGLPFCDETNLDTTPTATPAASNEVINRLIVDVADLKEQVAVLATKVAQIEGGSGTGAATPTPTPSATPASVIEASPTPTATPSPTPTSVAGTSGGNACIERLANSGSVNGVWADNCLSANAPDDGNAYYARFYTFTLVAAADVTITLSAAKPPYIYLLEGVGTDGKVMRDAGNASQTSQTITASLQAGSYTIEAATWNPNVTGDFTLTLDTGQ